MTRDQIIDRVLARCRRSSGEATYVAHLVAEFTLMQTTILERGPIQPWFLFKAKDDIVIDAGGLTAPLPTDFLNLPQVAKCLYLPQEEGGETFYAPLERMGFADQFGGVESASSIAGWEIQNGTICFTEEVDTSLAPLLFYFGREVTNETAYGSSGQPTTNKWCVEASDLCIAELGYVFAGSYLRDEKQEARFASDKQMAWQRLITQTTLWEEGGVERFINQWTYRPRVGVGGRVAT